ncbi:hypothetical protein GGR56DRAFT_616297 [Xylariaceae sp. FL0804]|nr:hypothetical protein GGR56DRAFT_616297 [Xylariaceae sp. FL0804]
MPGAGAAPPPPPPPRRSSSSRAVKDVVFSSSSTSSAAVAAALAEPAAKKPRRAGDEETISANIRAVFPNWTPADPTFMLRHGFAEPPEDHRDRHQLLKQQRQRRRRRRRTNSSSALSVDSCASDSSADADDADADAACASSPAPRRNAGHDLPEIVEGPYADFLDRHGRRAEHFPHAMTRQLEAGRAAREQRQRERARSPTPTPTPPVPAERQKRKRNKKNRRDISGEKQQQQQQQQKPRQQPVFVVMHTQQGGYATVAAGLRMHVHGVFGAVDAANVRAMEVFQKQHRDFMLDGQPDGATGSAGIPFVQARARNAAVNGCEASWWIDGEGCLALRAANWGSGDGRIFVVAQDFYG